MRRHVRAEDLYIYICVCYEHDFLVRSGGVMVRKERFILLNLYAFALDSGLASVARGKRCETFGAKAIYYVGMFKSK